MTGYNFTHFRRSAFEKQLLKIRMQSFRDLNQITCRPLFFDP